jgi:DNA-binding NarL/FixJ family response regulator
MGSAVRLFLVSPAQAVRHSLAKELARRDEIVVVGGAGSSAQGISVVPTVRPEVVLAGAHMRDPDSIEMCRRLRAAVPDLPILLLGMYPGQELISAAITAGAAGVLLHTADVDELVQAIETAAGGHMVIATDTLMRMLRDERLRATRDPVARLTPLERELFALVGQGLTNPEIATRLKFSNGTVRNYVSGLLRKLDLDRRAQVVALAARRDFTGHASA